MKASVSQGGFDLYNPDLVPSTGIVGVAQCEAGADFRYKNTLVMTNRAATTYQSIFSVNGILWTTPSVEYVIEYISLRYKTNLTAVRTAGPAFSTLIAAVEINDSSGGNHSIIDIPSTGFAGATYDISTHRSLQSTAITPGFALSAYNALATDQGGAVGKGGVFHAYGSNWFGQPLWFTFLSEPTAWTMSGTIELTICGKILG